MWISHSWSIHFDECPVNHWVLTQGREGITTTRVLPRHMLCSDSNWPGGETGAAPIFREAAWKFPTAGAAPEKRKKRKKHVFDFCLIFFWFFWLLFAFFEFQINSHAECKQASWEFYYTSHIMHLVDTIWSSTVWQTGAGAVSGDIGTVRRFTRILN